MESDLKEFIESNLGVFAYPIIIPSNTTLPAILYKEISFNRNSDSSLNDSNIRNIRTSISVVSNLVETTIDLKQQTIELFEGFAGLMGSTTVFSSRVVSSVPMYDHNQQTFEHTIDVMFIIKI